MLPTAVLQTLVARASETPTTSDSDGSGDSSGDSGSSGSEFLQLIQSPFDSELYSSSFLSSLLFSLILTVVLTIVFSLIRPYHNAVYAPRAKHADSKHAPPPVSKGVFGWAFTIMRIREDELVEKLGMDGAVFMRFVRMMRNIFSILTVVGCGILIPTNLLAGTGFGSKGQAFLVRLTPQFIYGGAVLWVYVAIAYIFDIVVCFFLWRNYRAILLLRRRYFESSEYQSSLHSRTILLSDIPQELRSDDGILRITEQVQATNDTPRAAIARNVKGLPKLIEEHDESVRALEGHLAKYLKNPNRLPDKRPTCKVSANDKSYTKGQKVDAIEYLTSRVKELEVEIKEVRESIDKRNAMSYGFASYDRIVDAHSVAYVARKKGPQKTIIQLAPRPNDLIWKNLPMLKSARDRQNFIGNIWVALLTVLWIGPNVLIAVFLTNLSNLGNVWPAFKSSLQAHKNLWALVQGILAPAITTAFYYFLPKLFRLLVTRAGDQTRTSRERHVMHKLFSFFLFNNLIVFSLFSAVWAWVAAVISASKKDESAWDAIKSQHPFQHIVSTLITVSPYWTFWLLQRNLGSAVDLSQLLTLFLGQFKKRFMSPTPRELIELSAPQPFDYANYYNYFLFYCAVTLSFGSLQPLVLPITALYFWMDSFSKKYLLLYIFITKYESGGMFWRTLFNRMLICAFIGNVVIALLVVTRGTNWAMLGVLAPLPFLLIGFKVYCMRTFDSAIHFYHQGSVIPDSERITGEQKKKKSDRVGVRFGNPLLYKPLATPMVSSKSQHLLKQVYTGRLSMEQNTVGGYSDVYMDNMDSNKPGKSSAGTGPFEIVGEHQLDYEHWKHDANFAHEGSADGELYGHPADMHRPGTPSSMMTGPTRTGTWESDYSSRGHSRSQSRGSDGGQLAAASEVGVTYPKGYHMTPSALREQSPAGSEYSRRPQLAQVESREPLVSSAAGMGISTAPQGGPMSTSGFGVAGGYGPVRLTPGETPTPGEEDTSYDYFRRGRTR